YVVGNVELVPMGFELEDRDPRFEVRRLDVHAQPPAEPANQSLLKAGELVGRAIGGDHDLTARSMQVVEGVEELRLRLFLLHEELDVVDEQNVVLAEPLAETIALALADGLDEL